MQTKHFNVPSICEFRSQKFLMALTGELTIKEELCEINLIEEDDGGRWNIVDNTYNRDTWFRFTE